METHTVKQLEEFLRQVEKSVKRPFRKEVILCSVQEALDAVEVEPRFHPDRKNEIIAAGSIGETLVCDRFVKECMDNDEMTEYLKSAIDDLSYMDILIVDYPCRDAARAMGITDPY